MRLRNRLFEVLTFAGAVCAARRLFVLGQQPPAATPAIPATLSFRTDTRLVLCNATVMDKTGHLVTNLPQAPFTVFENGVPQPIKVFKREDVPVSMGLIIDNSGSMREKRAKVEAAALALVKDSNPQDEVFIVNFNDEAFLDADFTNDIKDHGRGPDARSIRAAARPCATPSACPSIT